MQVPPYNPHVLSLSPGTRLGPYELGAAIGAGGMGEVYRARDTKLNRDVAIKVLPASVAQDPDRRARFEREARAVAALSHPNILAIFDFGVDGAVAYAVMELLDGESLRERLTSALPVRKATEVAIQIARGLAAAHDKGLVHRDLKPENVFLLADGQVKLLDFGLAKSVESGSVGQTANSETIAGTDPGTVMGTAGYMAPEQIRRGAVDGRADLFALGAVLYEMLSGQRAFVRDTAAETLTAILKEDPPDLAASHAGLPPSLDRIVRHCLEKSPAERFQSARDVAFALEALSGSGSGRAAAAEARGATRRTGVSPLAMAGAITLTAIAAGLAGRFLRAPVPPSVRALDIAVEGLDVQLDHVPVISPDGRSVLFFTEGRLWTRELDGVEAIELPGTEDAQYGSWSPDSRAVAYVQKFKLYRIPIDGGKGVTLGNVPADMSGSGATLWLRDGRILLTGSDSHGISEISDRGGDVKDIVPLKRPEEGDFHEMSALPDGRGVLFAVHRVASQRSDTIEAYVDGARHVVFQLPGENLRQPVYSPTGHLVYYRESTNPGVWAIRFMPRTLKTEGPPFLVLPAGSWPSVGADGTLAFVRQSSARPDLVWVDRAGTVTRITTLPQAIAFPQDGMRNIALSPDGRRAAVALHVASASDLWVYDFARDTSTQITQNAGHAVFPTWMPDGRRLVFASFQGGRVWNLFDLAPGGGPVRRLTTSEEFQYPGGVAPDGRSVVFTHQEVTAELFVLPLDASGAPGAPVRITNTPELEAHPRLSPDGRWVAYGASQSGRSEVYVRAYPSGSDPRKVSADGGSVPAWSHDGRELLFRNGLRVMAAAVMPGRDGFESAPPRPLFTAARALGLSDVFDVAADGRLLMFRSIGHDRITLILNWPEELKRVEASGARR